MKRAHCQDCGKTFLRETDEDWKTRCVPCFKKSKRAESAAADSYWPARAAAAESLAAQLQTQLEQQAATIRILSNRPAAAAPSRLDRELAENWRALVQLVHPDKHNGSQGATRLTQWLNDIKPRLPCV